MELVERLRKNAEAMKGGHTGLPSLRYISACGSASENMSEAADLLEEALKALEECANDLEAEVQQRWGYDERLAHKLERDLAPVVTARAILTKSRGEKIA